MTCELYEIRKQLDDLQRKLESYERKHGGAIMSEHDSILDSVEKMRGIRANDNERRKKVD